MENEIIVLEENLNGSEIKIVERTDKNGNNYYSYQIRAFRKVDSFGLFNGVKSTRYCSFLLSEGAHEFYLDQMLSLGEKVRFAIGEVFLAEEDSWIDANGKEQSSNRKAFCVPMTKQLFQEGWFDKNAKMSKDAIRAISWDTEGEDYFFEDPNLAVEAPASAATFASANTPASAIDSGVPF